MGYFHPGGGSKGRACIKSGPRKKGLLVTFTELARYNRSFNGVRSELRTERVGLNLFATETGHGFVKDEIRGDWDELFRQAAEVCIQNGGGSTSLLQRRLRIGYAQI